MSRCDMPPYRDSLRSAIWARSLRSLDGTPFLFFIQDDIKELERCAKVQLITLRRNRTTSARGVPARKAQDYPVKIIQRAGGEARFFRRERAAAQDALLGVRANR